MKGLDISFKIVMGGLSSLVLSLMLLTGQAQAQLVLKPAPYASGSNITIGDVFDGAADKASLPLGTRQGPTLVLNAAQLQTTLQSLGLYWDNPRGLRQVIIKVSGAAANETHLQTKPDVKHMLPQVAEVKTTNRGTQQVLIFNKAMNAGDIIAAEDLSYAELDVKYNSSALVKGPELAVGKTLKWPIRQGGLVRDQDLQNPIIIKKGDPVDVIWRSQTVSLTMTGIAQKDGAAGDLIPIENPTSKKTIEARITGMGQAMSGPSSPRQLPPNYLASR